MPRKLKTLTTTRGRTVKVTAASRLLVRTVFRSGATVSVTDGRRTVDLATYPTTDLATEAAAVFAERTGLPVSDRPSIDERLPDVPGQLDLGLSIGV